MIKKYATHSDSQRLAIRSKVNLSSEIVAPYWALSTFTSNNPLRELEYLHFEEAVKRAQQVRGGRGYLPNETYRDLFRRGLINIQCLEEVLDCRWQRESVKVGTRTVQNTEVFRASLLNSISAPADYNLSALIDSSPQRTEIYALSALLGLASARSLGEDKAQQVAAEDSDGLGKTISFSQWCDRFLGTAIGQTIDDELIQWCSSFLDEGQAAWSQPMRKKTLYKAWKHLSLLAPSTLGCESKSWRATIESLPESPEDCILSILADLGIPESQEQDYLALHLAALPGWSGFVKWRAECSSHLWQKAYPADLTQYVAIRLVYEHHLVTVACRQKLDIEPSLSALKRYMSENPSVYLMLRERADSKLDVNLSRAIDRQWYRGNHIDKWRELAARYLSTVNEKKNEIVNRSHAWRLVELSKCLGLSSQELLGSSPEELFTLLDWFDQFPPESHGIVWLKAMEASYQQSLIAKLCQVAEADSNHKAVEREDFSSQQLRPQSQSLFCIDVRSEPFRRHLESVGRNQTFGVAGFFLCFIRYQAIDSEHLIDQFPVIMKARNIVREVPRPYEHHKVERFRERSALLRNARALLHNLKDHFITPFVTVESIGWFYSLPFFFKTIAPLAYRDFSHWLRRFVESPVATTLTIDKLSPAEANEMVLANQLGIIRSVLQERFAAGGGPVTVELAELVHRCAMAEADSEDSLSAITDRLPIISNEEARLLVADLRRVYRIIPRGTAAHMERITRTGFTLEEQVFTVETALRMIGLTTNFARIVIVCGHGSTSDNNPFESALDCGACGGNEGHANSRAFAAMANKLPVREMLAKKGIEIPTDTHFIPARVDTTTDVVRLLDLEDVPTTHRLDLARITEDLEQASRLTSAERCLRFPELPTNLSQQQAVLEVMTRSADWSQVRPEWGLSGNASFIIARREITKDVNLEGRAFLNSYDYLADPDGKLLEVIMTAPQVVTQWINMQYYFAVTDNDCYGSGSKVYHNVVDHIGVMYGNKSDLRTGLPWQTVMNGDLVSHEPLRLTSVIEAPRLTIDKIVSRHELLKRFYHNEWVHLIAYEREEGRFYRYSADGQWQVICAKVEEKMVHANSF
jgi:uncharacterized protein YbcC (UPF0753/DUF2309 family)